MTMKDMSDKNMEALNCAADKAAEALSMSREAEQLNIWKQQAMAVLTAWGALFDALPKSFAKRLEFLGKSQQAVVAEYIKCLETENARLKVLAMERGVETV
jgi:hypothetical protein